VKKLLFVLILFATPVSAQEIYPININRLCAKVVNIPYASDAFSDEKWEEFKRCLSFVKQYVD